MIHLWPDVFPDGKIAVVGNGRSVLGRGKGAEIDAADSVFRFHFYEIAGFENDVGSRCDYWVSAFYRSGLRDGLNVRGIFCPLPIDSAMWEQRWKNSVYDDGHNVDLVRSFGAGVCCAPEDLCRHLWRWCQHPSTGAALAWWLYWARGLEDVIFYGFDHFADQGNTHYWQDNVACGGHVPFWEARLFAQLGARYG